MESNGNQGDSRGPPCTEHSADQNSLSSVLGLWPHMTQWSKHLGWEVFNHHPPYSLDLTPSDFNLLLHLKKFLPGQHQRFQNDRDMETSVTVVLVPGSRLLRHRIQKLVPWYDKCFNSRGEYGSVQR